MVNRRKAYTLDVVFNKLNFREVLFFLSIISSLLQKKKQTGWLRKCLFKYSTDVRVVLEILKDLKVKVS